MMLSCWNIRPDTRPPFRCLASKLENILLSTEDYLRVETEGEDINSSDTASDDTILHTNRAETESLMQER